jgi:hypothetical protein
MALKPHQGSLFRVPTATEKFGGHEPPKYTPEQLASMSPAAKSKAIMAALGWRWQPLLRRWVR